MALSAETEAIIERLKAEGQLTRNSGANSIRSVKVQLDRFEGIFNTISGNIAEQTNMLRASMGIQEEAIEAQKRANDLAELQNSNPPPPPEKPKPPEPEKPKPESKGIFQLLGGFASTLLGIGSKLALGGAGLFVAYNFAKGAIDEATGGGFTRFENSMIDTFRNVNWEELGTSFQTFATKVPEAITAITDFLSDPLGAFLAGAGLTAAGIMLNFGGGALARGVTQGIISGVLGTGAGAGSAGGGGKGLINLRNVAKAGALGILTGALSYYGDDVKNWLQTQGMPEDWANTTVDSAVTIGTFTSIGMMFGPKGALVMAAIGSAYVLGKSIYNWMTGAEERGKAALEARLNAIDVIEGKFPELGASGAGSYDEVGIHVNSDLNTSGRLGSVSVSNLTNSTEEEKTAIAARLYNDKFAEALEKAAEGAADDPATIEAARQVQEMLSQAAIQDLLDTWGPKQSELMSQVNMLGDNLGVTDGDAGFNRYAAELRELDALVQRSGGNMALTSMRDQLRANMKRQFQGITSSDEDFNQLTPAQQEVLRMIESMESNGGSIGPVSSMTRDQAIMRQIAESGAMSGMSQVVIGKMGGDTYMSNNSTKMGDQNVAQITQIGTGGNPMSPLKVVG